MNEFDYSNTGLALTRSFEGLRLKAYQDSAGVWTIGYGHTGPEVHHGHASARSRLRHCCVPIWPRRCVPCGRRVQVSLAQHQFDALVDFCFNAGRGSFLGSSLLRYINRGEFESAVVQFGLWVHAGGKVFPGWCGEGLPKLPCFQGMNCRVRFFGESTSFHRGGSGRTRIGTGPDRKGAIA